MTVRALIESEREIARARIAQTSARLEAAQRAYDADQTPRNSNAIAKARWAHTVAVNRANELRRAVNVLNWRA